MPMMPRSVLVRHVLPLLLAAAFHGAAFAATELADQRQLSRAAGTFAASRYLVYEGSDERHHHFGERSKFGPLGPSGRYRVARSAIRIEGVAPGAVITYDQNAGTFTLRSQGSTAVVIPADFAETMTREEERYRTARDRLEQAERSGDARLRARLRLEAMQASYLAGYLDEADAHAVAVLGLRDRDAAHVAETVRGLVALRQGDIETARQRLAASAEFGPAPGLSSFGPNMLLADALLRAGDRESVLRYLDACQTFWRSDAPARWKTDIAAGRMPNFGANLRYGLH